MDPDEKLEKSNPVASGRLTDLEIATIKAEVEKYKDAQKQVTQAVGVLWNSQLDMAVRIGDRERIIDILRKPVAFYDNCDCGGPGPSDW